MPTLVKVQGWSARTDSANGGGIYNAKTGSGTVSFNTSVYRNSNTPQSVSYATTASYLYHTFTEVSGAGVIVGRISVYFPSSIPTSDGTYAYILAGVGNDSTFASVGISSSTNRLYVGQYEGTFQQSSMTISVDTWYDIDFRFTWNSTTHTIDWAVNNIAQTQYSVSGQTNTTFSGLRTGFTAGTNATGTVYMWGMCLSTTSADHPIGDTSIACLYPSSDGSHSNASNCIEDQAGNDINGSTYTAYDKINSVQPGTPNTTNYLRVGTASAAKYADMNLTDLPSNATPKGVFGNIAYTSATTSGNNAGTVVYDGSTERTIWGATGAYADYSDGSTASLYFKSAKISPTNLTESGVNSLKLRFISGDDATPDPYLIDAWLEVAYAPAITISFATGSSTASGKQLTVSNSGGPITLAKGASTTGGQKLTVTPGAVSITLNSGSSTASGKTATITPGAISKTLNTGTSTASGKTLTTSSEVTRTLNSGSSSSSGKTLTVAPGGVTVNLSPGSSTDSGKSLTVDNVVPIILACGSSTAAGLRGYLGFPTVRIRDNFNKPELDTNWFRTANKAVIVDGKLTAGDTDYETICEWLLVGPAVEVYVTVGNLDTTSRLSFMEWALDWGTGFGYSYRLFTSALTNTGCYITFRKYNSTGVVDLRTSDYISWSSRTSIKTGVRHYADGLCQVFIDRGSGWELVFEYTDSEVLKPGAVIFAFWDGTNPVQITYDDVAYGTLNEQYNKLSNGSSTSSGKTLTVQSSVTIGLGTGTSTASGKSASITPGAVTKTLNSGSCLTTGKALTVTPGGVSITLNTGVSTASGKLLTVAPGAVITALNFGGSSTSGKTLTVTPGAVSVSLGVGSSSTSGKLVSVSSSVTVSLSTGASAASGKTVSVTPGGVTINLNAGNSISSGKLLTVTPGGITVALGCGGSTTSGKKLSVTAGGVTVGVSYRNSSTSGKSITVTPGSVQVNLNKGNSTASGKSVSIATAVTVFLQNGQSEANGIWPYVGFPTVRVRDNFNRTDLGDKWLTYDSNVRIVDNKLVDTGLYTTYTVYDYLFDSQIETYLTIGGLTSQEAELGLYSASRLDIDEDSNSFLIRKLTNTGCTLQDSLNNEYSVSWASRDTVKIGFRVYEVLGDGYMQIFLDRGSGWEFVGSGSTFMIRPGYIHIWFFANFQNLTIDDFGAGSLNEQFIQLNSGSSTSSGNAITITPGAISVGLGKGSSTSSGASATASPGSVSIVLATGSSTTSGRAIQATPGGVTVPLSNGNSYSAGLAISAGSASTTYLACGSSSAPGKKLSVTPGGVSPALATGNSVASGENLSVTPGEVTVSFAKGTCSSSGKSMSVTPGEVSPSLSTGSSTATGSSLSVYLAASPITIGLSYGTCSTSGKSATVASSATVYLGYGASSTSGKTLTVQPGSVIIGVSVGSSAVSGRSLLVTSGGVSVQLLTGGSVAYGKQVLASPGGITALLSKGASTTSGKVLGVTPGSVGLALAKGSSLSSGRVATVINTNDILMLAGSSYATGYGLSVLPGAVTTQLYKGSSYANGQRLSTVPGGVSTLLGYGTSTTLGNLVNLVSTVTVGLGRGTSSTQRYPLSVEALAYILIGLQRGDIQVSGKLVSIIPGAVIVDLDTGVSITTGYGSRYLEIIEKLPILVSLEIIRLLNLEVNRQHNELQLYTLLINGLVEKSLRVKKRTIYSEVEAPERLIEKDLRIY